MVKGTDGIAFGHEIFDQVCISPAVLSPAVDHQQDRLGICGWQPALIIEAEALAPSESTFCTFHGCGRCTAFLSIKYFCTNGATIKPEVTARPTASPPRPGKAGALLRAAT